MRYPVKLKFVDDGLGQTMVTGLPPFDYINTCGYGVDGALEFASDALTNYMYDLLERNQPVPRPPDYFEADGVYWVEPSTKIMMPVMLQWARRDAGLTQTELARRLGKPQSVIAQLESPKSSPTVKTMDAVAKALGKKLTVAIV